MLNEFSISVKLYINVMQLWRKMPDTKRMNCQLVSLRCSNMVIHQTPKRRTQTVLHAYGSYFPDATDGR